MSIVCFQLRPRQYPGDFRPIEIRQTQSSVEIDGKARKVEIFIAVRLVIVCFYGKIRLGADASVIVEKSLEGGKDGAK